MVEKVSYVTNCFCLRDHEFWEIIRERPGGKKAIEDDTEDGLFTAVHRFLKRVTNMKGITEEKAKLIMTKHSRTWADARI